MMRLRISLFPQIMMGAVICLCSLQTHGFVISDVRVEGLQRVSAGTVFGAIPFNVGDDIDEVDLDLSSQLFLTSPPAVVLGFWLWCGGLSLKLGKTFHYV